MTHCHPTPTDVHLNGGETLRKVFQQAIDQYPRLAAFLLMLPGVTPEAVQRFHNSVYQQVSELAVTRQLSWQTCAPDGTALDLGVPARSDGQDVTAAGCG
ncbi:hypothetical protein I4T90_001689 [Salmonella enterica subsp. enterica serovar Panama]|uniref:Uncharacterized protein n=1 Tax=Salmonella enterica subsp. enterica serovar Panama TaxID=29472 RepID=A0A752DN72_SALET|nr:hypothetical protein [Salmonella enterica]EGS7285513.1 hypothetical protein [Salmonella enterica subsp. enterica serovar Panama]EGS7544065.1 hypothetical protein [Salmonella enterica subsp. enterica serovar Panama]EHC9769101.1 hypothetical protein [Salmonella enterica subsp. enterica serovar Panama]HAF7257941.1 hypothetical protein [Salmonella enterica subsp. enterica serovar Panama]